MEFTVLNQTSSFLYSAVIAFTTGIIYEFFKCLKYTLFKKRIVQDFLDIAFVLVCAVFLFFSFYSVCALSFRFYHFLGFFLGIIIYFNSINRIIYKIIEKILIIFKEIFKILLYPVKIFSKIILGVLSGLKKIVEIPVKYVRAFYQRIKKSLRGIIKRKKKV